MQHRWRPAALSALLITAPLFVQIAPAVAAPTAAGAIELDTSVVSIAKQLRQSWKADPGTAGLPWPVIEVLSSGQTRLSACRDASQAAAMATANQSPALYCAASGKVLLDRSRLARDSNRYGHWGVAYWVGIGLGEAIRNHRAGSLLPPAAANLQTNCLAGVLIGGTSLQPIQPRQRAAPADGAYNTAAAEQMGTRSQRAYALLTGLGVTDLGNCSDGAMAQLAKDQVPDPMLLSELAQGTDLASSNLLAVLNRRCRPLLPKATCPRRVANSQGQKLRKP